MQNRPIHMTSACMFTQRKLPVVVDRSSSDSVAIHYVLPVLRMTSYFHTIGSTNGRVKHDVMFRRVRHVAIPIGRTTTTVFA